MVNNIRLMLATIVGLALIIILFNASYFVDEKETVIITQFGEIRGEPITDPGLHFLIPFIQKVNKLEKRFLEWDGQPEDITTGDKVNITVDTYARWRISDPVLYFQRLGNERKASNRLGEILNDQARNTIAKNELIELVRTSNREILQPDIDATDLMPENFPKINIGREQITREIIKEAAEKTRELGIELLDLRFKRIKYVESVQKRIFERMRSERMRIADKFRSEGQGEKSKILGDKERDLKEIESDAYRIAQEIRGNADARATTIYAAAYDRNTDTRDFYRFLKTMETYEQTMTEKDLLVLSTKSDFFKFLEKQSGR